MDISPDRHSVDIGRLGLLSINRARAFLNRELLKGKTGKAVCLRRAWDGEEGKEEDEEEEREELGGDMASGAASTALLQDIESAKELFFVVEERPRAWPETGTGPGAATNENAIHEAAGTSSSPSSVRSSGGEGASRDNGGGGSGLRRDAGDEHKGGSSSRAAGEDGDYFVPYWAILRVGELTNDPGVTPEPWPLHGVSNGRAAGGQHGTTLAVPRSQMPPPSQVHRPPNVPDSVGYRIVYINVKVSIHHPRGSSVAADKDAVIDGVTRVRER